jgi:hypothetical protein
MNKIENSPFKRLLGVWKTTGNVQSDQENVNLMGTDSYELILDGNCILHKAHVKMGNERSETFEIMKLDASSEKAKMHYFNSKGEEGIMTSSITENEFNIEGKDLKFAGIINAENTLITGKWYIQSENGNWNDFMEIQLEFKGF